VPAIQIHPEVADALASNRPVVALESAVITAGLPRESAIDTAKLNIPGWRVDQPVNLELAMAMQRYVRNHGATPATIAVLDGSLHIGLTDAHVVRLASEPNAGKISCSDLAHAVCSGGSAGATVAATLLACALPPVVDPSLSPIRFFATGGIGGVHRDWMDLPDISADLAQLARTQVCVICAGAKSILDLPATLESLESLAVPVVGYRTHRLPQFYSTGTDDLRIAQRIDDARSAARLCRMHWHTLHSPAGLLLANPAPEEFALDAEEINQAVALAESLATARGVAGKERTPFLLAELARRTDGRTLLTNIALLLNNARLAAEVAVAWSEAS
jgi:pseudouridylate synthase